jgi:hypothetical protein
MNLNTKIAKIFTKILYCKDCLVFLGECLRFTFSHCYGSYSYLEHFYY